MIGSVFSIPLLLDSVGEETVKDMLQTFSCVYEGVQLNDHRYSQIDKQNYILLMKIF